MDFQFQIGQSHSLGASCSADEPPNFLSVGGSAIALVDKEAPQVNLFTILHTLPV